MTTRVVVVFCSRYGHEYQLARGAPYGASTITQGDASRQTSMNELPIAPYQRRYNHRDREGALRR